jgi:hypothetical protein
MPELKTLTPECDKLLKVREFSQKIGEFIEWLKQEQGIVFCRANNSARHDTFYELAHHIRPDVEARAAHRLMDDPPATAVTTQNLLAAFFEIDLDKVEDEKQALLAELRRKP